MKYRMWFREFNYRIMLFAIIATLSIGYLSLNAQPYAESFRHFTENPAVRSAHTGFMLADVGTGEIIFQHNPSGNFIPASVQKIITTIAASEILGAQYTFSTPVVLSGKIESGILNGNLIIKASGDPSIEGEKLIEAITGALGSKGISQIKGEIIIDESEFENDLPRSWSYEDLGNHYGSAAYGFNFNKNSYHIVFQQAAEGKPVTLLKTDAFVPYKFENKVMAGKPGSGDNAYILGVPFSMERQLVGTIPPGSGTFTIKGSMHHPAYFFRLMLKEKLQQSGIAVSGEKMTDANLPADTILRYRSQVLTELINVINRESNNLYAEALLKAMAKESGVRASTENGIAVVEKYFNDISLPLQKNTFRDGSGLSRMNLMTPEFMLKLLLKHASDKDFRKSLAVAGETGTLRAIASARLKSRMMAKSGSSTGILNYAGYIDDANGRKYAFVIFVNNFSVPLKEARAAIVKLLESVL
jgi:serine-type D-Ala-D-Ala carboxypeptidase/endopeptidase (penicillin-binding protein 4)